MLSPIRVQIRECSTHSPIIMIIRYMPATRDGVRLVTEIFL